jgi:hypothetical protein
MEHSPAATTAGCLKIPVKGPGRLRGRGAFGRMEDGVEEGDE